MAQLTFYDENSFEIPNLIVASAWLEHGPFAIWVASRLKPDLFVELGTHNGYSYFCFAQSISKNNVRAKMYAIDTWKGDEHAGYYGNEIYDQVAEINLRDYGQMSHLLKETFDEGLNHFGEGSIDLLHIDGLHTYEAVMHDFKSWLPKMSEKGIVLFHDINVRERGFGVFKLWAELKDQYPSFEFLHGHGLGVLKVGKLQTEIDDFFSADDEDACSIQRFYELLGRRVTLEFEWVKQGLQYESRLEIINSDASAMKLAYENERLKNINQINSRSWKITRPLRFLNRSLTRFSKKVKTECFSMFNE
jgi:hypothetical protein